MDNNNLESELNENIAEPCKREGSGAEEYSNTKPFDFIKRCDPSHVFQLLAPELPQTIAVVLSYLEPDKAAVLLQNFPQEVQGEVAKRVAMLNVIEPDTIMVIKKILEKKLLTAAQGVTITPGGIDSIVEIINLVDRASEIQIIKMLEEEDPELAEEIKNRMFTFDDIVMLDDRAIQKVLREIDNKDVLAKALKGADMNVQNKIFKNLTKHAAETLKEDLESIGPVLLRDVENAQSQIVSIIRNLEEKGEIVPVSEGDLAV